MEREKRYVVYFTPKPEVIPQIAGVENIGECPFCNLQIDYERFKAIKQVTGIDRNHPSLLDSRTGVIRVVPDYFPVRQGHLLLISKRHVPSMAQLTELEFREKEAVKAYIARRLGPCLFFEHGGGRGESAQSITHAHEHCVRVDDQEAARIVSSTLETLTPGRIFINEWPA